ncbi:hypothetical protein F4782DRAFT_526906 [Xylaria castorea]|nr:hypothetical protein F4782DRAFT_526906 [Xylaria castorea]
MSDDLIKLSLLRDFKTDVLIAAEILDADEKLSHLLDQKLVIRFGELDLDVTAGVSYPTYSVFWHVENYTLSQTSVDSLPESKSVKIVPLSLKRTAKPIKWPLPDMALTFCISKDVVNDGKEYVVFSSSQIIPVYLIHIDWGLGNEHYFRSND